MDELLNNAVILGALAGMILSLFFGFFPKVKVWYAGKADEFKSAFMLVMTLGVAIGLAVWSEADITETFLTIIFSMVGNQTFFGATKRLRK